VNIPVPPGSDRKGMTLSFPRKPFLANHYSYSVYLDYDERPHLLVGYPTPGLVPAPIPPSSYVQKRSTTASGALLPSTTLGPALPPPTSYLSHLQQAGSVTNAPRSEPPCTHICCLPLSSLSITNASGGRGRW